MDNEVVIEIPELQVLLNLMNGPVAIKYPLYDFDIAVLKESRTGFVFSGMCSRDDFEDATGGFGELAYDMPSYNDLIQSLLVAGILPYRNIEVFEKLQASYRAMNKSVLFSLDTNLLYDGFPSQAEIDASDYLLVDIVQAEIESALNTKYLPQVIAQLKRQAPFEGKVLDEMVNQRMKRSRLAAYGALAEFQKIRDKAQIVKAGEPATSDKEKNDLVIVRALKAFEREKYSSPIHLTADTNVAELCRAEGVAHYLFEFPHTIDVRECSPSAAIVLLSRFAIAFGVVKCNAAFIYGEFKGKGARRQSLKVVIRNPALYAEFTKELELCRTLSKLNIER
ncbi:MAG TPA: hypothetical protein PKJ91_00250 [Methanoregulaceae archaeon]|nr:hypothetical protein [Methanoregulaceae archaeon]